MCVNYKCGGVTRKTKKHAATKLFNRTPDCDDARKKTKYINFLLHTHTS